MAAGVLAMAAAIAFGVVILVHHVSRPDPLNQVDAKYESRYEACVAHGGAQETCTAQVGNACAADPFFRNDSNDISDISTTCLHFGRK